MGSDSPQASSHAEFDVLFDDCARLYFSGQIKVGLELSADGVRRARTTGDRASLRKLLHAHAVFQSDLHNLPQAFEAFSEALDLCDKAEHASFAWLNISAALAYAELPRLAASAAHVALDYANKVTSPRSHQLARGAALANVAYACLFTKEYGLGLRSSRAAIEVLEGRTSHDARKADAEVANFLVVLTIHVRLLLRVSMLDEAAKCLENARALARGTVSIDRVTLVVELTGALLDTYCGNFDRGVARLVEFVLSETTPSPVLVADALRHLVEAYLVANRPQRAAEHMRQLSRHMQHVRSEAALFHHRRYIGWLASIGHPQSPNQEVRQTERSVVAHTKDEHWAASQRSLVLEDLCAAAELHDDPSGMHSHRVAELARLLALQIGIEKSQCDRIALAAKLHDVGKIGIPPAILSKPAQLDEAESEIMRSHSVAGAELLASAQVDDPEIAVAVARHHHEWWSGEGYPDGLAKDEIPLAARITAIAETFDAMTHDRPYRPRHATANAVDVIAKSAGRQFDPALAITFCALVQDLQSTHGDLDAYLEQSAKPSGFLRAKERFSEIIGTFSV